MNFLRFKTPPAPPEEPRKPQPSFVVSRDTIAHALTVATERGSQEAIDAATRLLQRIDDSPFDFLAI
jgi:hypothetical protein